MADDRITLKSLMQSVNAKIKEERDALGDIALENFLSGEVAEIIDFITQNAGCFSDDNLDVKLTNLSQLLAKKDEDTLRLTHAAVFSIIDSINQQSGGFPTSDDDPQNQDAIDSLLGGSEHFDFDESKSPKPTSQSDVDDLIAETSDIDKRIADFENPPEDNDINNLLGKLDNKEEKEDLFAQVNETEDDSKSPVAIDDLKSEIEPSFEEMVAQAQAEVPDEDEDGQEEFDPDKYLAESKITDFISPNSNSATAPEEEAMEEEEAEEEIIKPAKKKPAKKEGIVIQHKPAALEDEDFEDGEAPDMSSLEDDLAAETASQAGLASEAVKGEKVVGITYRLYLRNAGGNLLLSEAETEEKIKEDYLNLLPNYRARDLMLKKILLKEITVEREEALDLPVHIKISF